MRMEFLYYRFDDVRGVLRCEATDPGAIRVRRSKFDDGEVWIYVENRAIVMAGRR